MHAAEALDEIGEVRRAHAHVAFRIGQQRRREAPDAAACARSCVRSTAAICIRPTALACDAMSASKVDSCAISAATRYGSRSSRRACCGSGPSTRPGNRTFSTSAGNSLAVGRDVLRIGPLHGVDAAPQIARCARNDPSVAGWPAYRCRSSAPTAARSAPASHSCCGDQLPDHALDRRRRRPRRRRPASAPAAVRCGRSRHRHRLDASRRQRAAGKPAVIRVLIVGDENAVKPVRAGRHRRADRARARPSRATTAGSRTAGSRAAACSKSSAASAQRPLR